MVTNPGPKVFISSSILDLRGTRVAIKDFLTNMGFSPVLSEEPGFGDNPIVEPHVAC